MMMCCDGAGHEGKWQLISWPGDDVSHSQPDSATFHYVMVLGKARNDPWMSKEGTISIDWINSGVQSHVLAENSVDSKIDGLQATLQHRVALR